MPPLADSGERRGPNVHNIWLLPWKQPTQKSLGVWILNMHCVQCQTCNPSGCSLHRRWIRVSECVDGVRFSGWSPPKLTHLRMGRPIFCSSAVNEQMEKELWM